MLINKYYLVESSPASTKLAMQMTTVLDEQLTT